MQVPFIFDFFRACVRDNLHCSCCRVGRLEGIASLPPTVDIYISSIIYRVYFSPASLAFKQYSLRPFFISLAFRRRSLATYTVWIPFVTCCVSLTLSRFIFFVCKVCFGLFVYWVSHLDFFPSTWGSCCATLE